MTEEVPDYLNGDLARFLMELSEAVESGAGAYRDHEEDRRMVGRLTGVADLEFADAVMTVFDRIRRERQANDGDIDIAWWVDENLDESRLRGV